MDCPLHIQNDLSLFSSSSDVLFLGYQTVRTHVEHHSVKQWFTVGFPTEDAENYALQYSFQHMPGSLPAQLQRMCSFQSELNNGTKVSYKEKLKKKSNTPKKANTGSTKLPIPIITQLYWKRKVRTNSIKPVLRTRPNLLQSI
jgi:hypothetical protein